MTWGIRDRIGVDCLLKKFGLVAGLDTPADVANRARPSAVLRTVITSDQTHEAPQQDLLGRGLRNVRLVPPVGVEPTLDGF